MIKKYFFKDFCNPSEFGFNDDSYFNLEIPNLKEKNAMCRWVAETNGDQFKATDIIIDMAEKFTKDIYLYPIDGSDVITTFSDLSCCEIASQFINFFMELVKNGFSPKKS